MWWYYIGHQPLRGRCPKSKTEKNWSRARLSHLSELSIGNISLSVSQVTMKALTRTKGNFAPNIPRILPPRVLQLAFTRFLLLPFSSPCAFDSSCEYTSTSGQVHAFAHVRGTSAHTHACTRADTHALILVSELE